MQAWQRHAFSISLKVVLLPSNRKGIIRISQNIWLCQQSFRRQVCESARSLEYAWEWSHHPFHGLTEWRNDTRLWHVSITAIRRCDFHSLSRGCCGATHNVLSRGSPLRLASRRMSPDLSMFGSSWQILALQRRDVMVMWYLQSGAP